MLSLLALLVQKYKYWPIRQRGPSSNKDADVDTYFFFTFFLQVLLMQLPGPVRARLQQQYAERMRDLNEIYLQVAP